MRLVVRHNLRRERRPGVVAASRRCGNIWALACSDTARVRQGDNPFAALYRRWIAKGLSSKLARRNVARALATTLWGLWKNGSAYHPKWVGVPAAASVAARRRLGAAGC